jgi:hypothetical protein
MCRQRPVQVWHAADQGEGDRHVQQGTDNDKEPVEDISYHRLDVAVPVLAIRERILGTV